MAEKLHRLNGTVSGTQDQAVILGHGFGADQTTRDIVRPRIGAHFRVVAFDIAGAEGAHNHDARRYGSLFAYADDLLDIIDTSGSLPHMTTPDRIVAMLGRHLPMAHHA
jgi:sigma-B regulation protein RsbQ